LSYFLSTKEKKVIEKYQELMQWAEEQFELGNYTENAKIEFMCVLRFKWTPNTI
jgi:DNA-binding HxlR family transcriptional regulator